MNRRSFITAAAVVPIAGVAGAGTIDPQDEYRAMVRIRELTGMCLDDIAFWFEGLDLKRLICNIENAPAQRWSEDSTYAAMQSYHMGACNPTNGASMPMRDYMVRQIARKGDKPTVRRLLGIYGVNLPELAA